MLGKIERYTISELVDTHFQMPKGSQLLSVGMVGLDLRMWARIPESEGELEDRAFFSVSEYDQFEGAGAVFVGNCADLSGMAIHVFERVAG